MSPGSLEAVGSAATPIGRGRHAPWIATLVALSATASGGCDLSTTQPTGTVIVLALQPVVEGLSRPVVLTSPPGDSRLFVAEQTGAVRIIEDGSLLPTPFLDLTAQVSTPGPEQGLLGLAFHPDYAQNGRFFVDYTDGDGNTRVEEFSATPGASVADAASGSPILLVEQPQPNHNGGEVAFGPDGMLYVGLGDGGGAGDPEGNGQDTGTLLGSILRLDVDGEAPYEIPPDNPFVDDPEVLPEIWAYGLRNPWRFSWDTTRNLMILGDVGQDQWEEVDVVPSAVGGYNFGWNVMEGLDCFQATTCDQRGLELPQIAYDHDTGCSVVGGVVYRGAEIPELSGWYVFGDYCQGWIRVAALQAQFVTDVQQVPIDPPGSITAFGVDSDGEVYVLVAEGSIFRLVEEQSSP